MTYREEDWEKACRRLSAARQLYADYKAQSPQPGNSDALDDGILKCWSFGEYAINVTLECLGQPVIKDHSQPKAAKALFETGNLASDYSETLEKLERFRKKASHLGYVKERSTHYSSADLERCLTHMEALCSEVEELLQKNNKRQ